MTRKENALNQTSRELCATCESSGVYGEVDLTKPLAVALQQFRSEHPVGLQALLRSLGEPNESLQGGKHKLSIFA